MCRSGLTNETISATGIYSDQDGAVRKVLGWQPKVCAWGRGYFIPFPSPDGSNNGYCRIKLDYPRSVGERIVKYESPRGAGNRAYFPPGVGADMIKTAPLIILTEGEKKALAVSQTGTTCIGLTGVWNWQKKRKKADTGATYGERLLIDDLGAIGWKGKQVVICFDSDAADNTGVQLAESRLAETLSKRGAVVRVARIPSDGDGKVGADDYIIAHGVEAFQKLIAKSKPAEKPERPSSMGWARMFTEDRFQAEQGRTLQ